MSGLYEVVDSMVLHNFAENKVLTFFLKVGLYYPSEKVKTFILLVCKDKKYYSLRITLFTYLYCLFNYNVCLM